MTWNSELLNIIALSKVVKSVLVPSVLKWNLRYDWLSTQKQTSLNSQAISRKVEAKCFSKGSIIWLQSDLP